MRSEFQKPFGPVVQTGELKAKVKPGDVVVCVGDFVSKTALEVGLKPRLIVVDFQTERKAVGDVLRALLSAYGKIVVRVTNPPATVTGELYAAVLQAVRMPGPTRIEVEGEEDLAGLPVFAEAGEGTVVLYGMPKKGVVFVRVDEGMRAKAKALLARMKVQE